MWRSTFWTDLIGSFITGRKVKMQLKCGKMCIVCGEGAATDRTCQKWFAKLHAGEFSLDDAPWSGRPGEVDSDQMKTVTENNQRSTTRDRANILRTSNSVKVLVNMKNVSFILREKLNGLFGRPGTEHVCVVFLSVKTGHQ